MSDQFSRMSDQNLLLPRMSQNGKKVIISTVRGRQGIPWGNEGEEGGRGGCTFMGQERIRTSG